METVVHIGYPKTASSLLQLRLFAKHPQLHYPGLRNGNAEFDRALRREVMGRDSLSYDGSRAGAALAPFLRPHEPEAGTRRVCVVSAQGLSTTMQADPGLVAQRVGEIFGEAKILVCIRRQPDFLVSTYHEQRKAGPWRLIAPFRTGLAPRRAMSLQAWFDYRLSIDAFLPMLRRLDYWPLLRAYADVFGAQRMLVLPYEDLAADSARFLERICGFMGVEAGEAVRGICDEVVNPRRTSAEERVQHVHRDHPRVAALGRRLPPALRTLVRRTLERSAREEVQALREDQLAWIQDHCAQGNRAVAQTFGLDLASLDYPQ